MFASLDCLCVHIIVLIEATESGIPLFFLAGIDLAHFAAEFSAT